MTRPRRPSRFRRLAIALAIAGGVAALPRAAAAQACCVGTGLVTPARLRTFEDRALGVQMRARSVMGAFGGSGSYAASAAGNRDVAFEEDLFGALRFGSHFQLAISGAVRADVARGGRPVRLRRRAGRRGGQRAPRPGERRRARPLARRRDHRRTVAADRAAARRGGRRSIRSPPPAPAVDRSRARSGSRLKRSSAAASCRWRDGSRSAPTAPPPASSSRSRPACPRCCPGDTRSATTPPWGPLRPCCVKATPATRPAPIANSGVGLVTTGAAFALPFWQTWRLQTTLFTDLPIGGWGRNQTVGFGGTVAVIRFWI